MLYTCVRNLLDKRCWQTFKKLRAPDGLAGAKTHHNWPIAPFPAQGFAQRPCLRFHARQAKPNSNLGAQCCVQGLPNSAATQVPYVPRACQTPKKRGGPMIHAGSTKQCCDAGAAESNITRQRVLAFQNTLQFLQKQLLSDCSSKRFQVFSKANLETLKSIIATHIGRHIITCKC